MAHQITLTEEEYAALAAIAARSGTPIEELVHQAIAEHFPAARHVGTYSYPTGDRLTPEEQAEMERIAEELGPEKPWLSEMVSEDRGPR